MFEWAVWFSLVLRPLISVSFFLMFHNRAVLPYCSRVGASPDSWPRESWLQWDCNPALGEIAS